jgi:hypothetical protein
VLCLNSDDKGHNSLRSASGASRGKRLNPADSTGVSC